MTTALTSDPDALPTRGTGTFVPRGRLQQRGVKVLNATHRVGQFLVVVTVALLALSVIFLALSQAQMVNALSPLYFFSACIASFAILGVYHCCKKKIAEHYEVPFDAYERARIGIPKRNSTSTARDEDEESESSLSE